MELVVLSLLNWIETTEGGYCTNARLLAASVHLQRIHCLRETYVWRNILINRPFGGGIGRWAWREWENETMMFSIFTCCSCHTTYLSFDRPLIPMVLQTVADTTNSAKWTATMPLRRHNLALYEIAWQSIVGMDDGVVVDTLAVVAVMAAAVVVVVAVDSNLSWLMQTIAFHMQPMAYCIQHMYDDVPNDDNNMDSFLGTFSIHSIHENH